MFVIIVNIRIPPFINFYGEICCYVAIIGFGFYLAVFLFISIVFTGAVNFYLVSKIIKRQSTRYYLTEFNLREYFIMILLFVLVLVYTAVIRYV